MKLTKKITVDGVSYPLNVDQVRLDLFNPGRACFDVDADKKLSGLVVFLAGYDPQQLQQVFLGWIENCFQVDKRQQRIFCRELSGALFRLVPLSLRNINIKEIMAAISTETGLEFIVPSVAYADKKAPAFFSLGSGYMCMDAIAQIFSIPKFIWQQQGDGKIFCGSWNDSYWFGKPVEIPVDMQSENGLANSGKIPALPKLRPGAQLTTGHYITKLQWDGQHQNITWDANPWGTRWTNRSSV
jgi:hypothetical protein